MKRLKGYQQQGTTGWRRAAVVAIAMGVGAPALAQGGLYQALAEGKASADIRYRYESVDQSGIADQAGASTIRTRLGYTTGDYRDLGAYLEFEDISVIGAERYNSTLNGKGNYPVVLDPVQTEVNQGYVGYKGVTDTEIRLGRQRLIFDNARFVGNVGWRQNEQTFDALTVSTGAVGALKLNYAYLHNVNTIGGGNDAMASHLLHLSSELTPAVTLTVYGYLLDYDIAGSDSQTLGARLTGKYMLDTDRALGYTLEFAQQGDYADATSVVDADYVLAEATVPLAVMSLSAGYEVLGGNGTYAFQTPLATKHAFNGWADKFLATPASGLQDLNLGVSKKLGKTKLAAVYHDFSGDSGGQALGSEIDVLVVYAPARSYTLGLKAASYQADTYATDTDKIWLWAETRF